jgi:hypothetical protein
MVYIIIPENVICNLQQLFPQEEIYKTLHEQTTTKVNIRPIGTFVTNVLYSFIFPVITN